MGRLVVTTAGEGDRGGRGSAGRVERQAGAAGQRQPRGGLAITALPFELEAISASLRVRRGIPCGEANQVALCCSDSEPYWASCWWAAHLEPSHSWGPSTRRSTPRHRR